MRILILCTYPIGNPRHGGQLRVRSIVDSYREAGHDVDVVGVLGSLEYENEKGFLQFPSVINLSHFIENTYLLEDYAIARLFSEDDSHYSNLANKILNKPDIIQFEHPWLFPFAKRYVDEKNIRPLFIYSAHNVEWILKKEIISTVVDAKLAKGVIEQIKIIEEDAISSSDLISCVSESDYKWISSKTNNKVVLAPNGVHEWKHTEEGCRESLKITGHHRYALYCASSHPPNVTGFFEIFGGGFGSLKPDERLVIAGGAGWSIASDRRVHQSAGLAAKTVVAGVVGQQCLNGLLDLAHCIVLPLTQGGGTNLKTAEALWSGKHVVTTSIAMRGFERFIDDPGVYIADNPIDFKQVLRKVMLKDPLVLTKADVNKRSSVLWGSCLKSLVCEINKL